MDKIFLKRQSHDGHDQASANPPSLLFKHDLSALLDQVLRLHGQLGAQCARHAFDIMGAKAVTYARAGLDFMNAGNTISQKIIAGRLAALDGGKSLRSAADRRQLGKTADMARSAAISYRLACHELGWLREEIDLQSGRLADIADGAEALQVWKDLIDECQQQLAVASKALHGLPSELATLPCRPVGRIERSRPHR